MKKTTLIPVALLTAVFLSQTVCAEMYKWTDKNGETHYTQTPPPADAKGKDIEADIRLSTGKLGNTIPKTAANDNKQDELDKAREEGEKSEQKHRDFCAQQAEALKQMTANSLIKWKDDKGGERFLTAEEKNGKMQEMQKNIDSMCKPEMFSQKEAKEGNQTEQAVDARLTTDNSTLKQGDGANADEANTEDQTNPGKTGATNSPTPPLPAAD